MRDWIFARRLYCPGTDAAAADAATKGATDAAAAGAADTTLGATAATDVAGSAAVDAGALGSAGAGTAVDVGGGAVASDVGGTALSAAAPAAADAATAAAVDSTATAPLSEITISNTSLAGDAAAGGGAFNPAALAVPGGASMLMPSASGVDPAAQDVPQGGGGGDPTLDPAAQDVPLPTFDPGMVQPGGLSPVGTGDITSVGMEGGDSSTLDDFMKWFKQPKNAMTAAQLGLSTLGALRARQLPGAAKTALAGAGPAAQQAQMAIATGGKGSPLWTSEKAAIDASIDSQIQNATASMQQTMVGAGMGDKNSGIVKEQIAEITSQLEDQRQLLYDQALKQIVQDAISELTGANQTLMSVAQMQMAEDRFALQLATTGAQLAARLQTLSG